MLPTHLGCLWTSTGYIADILFSWRRLPSAAPVRVRSLPFGWLQPAEKVRQCCQRCCEHIPHCVDVDQRLPVGSACLGVDGGCSNTTLHCWSRDVLVATSLVSTASVSDVIRCRILGRSLAARSTPTLHPYTCIVWYNIIVIRRIFLFSVMFANSPAIEYGAADAMTKSFQTALI